jgi:hypothetical protein
MKVCSLLCIVLAMALKASGQVQLLRGTFALQGDSAKTDSYLKLTPIGGDPLNEHLDFWMTAPKSAQPIKRYRVEMTKKLHMVVVSNDFHTFLHIHPELRPDGHLLINQRFPANGVYQIYADGEPNDLNHQVFRFEVPIGKPGPLTPRVLPSSGMGVQVGPYEVDLSTVRVHAGRMEMIDVEILKDGKPAKDLHPYLGVPAHAVFLNSKDLSYVHVHPMAMDAGMNMDMSKPMPDMPDTGPSSGEMMLHVAIREAGSYKLWLQFRGNGQQLYVAEFTLTAS